MRVVIDTNVLVSAALKIDTIPRRTVLVAAKNHEILKSSYTEQELVRTIVRPRLTRLISSKARAWLRLIIAEAQRIPINEQISACRDPEDDKFLELAVGGRADIIMSGDADLLALNPFRGIPIETPAGFLRRVRG